MALAENARGGRSQWLQLQRCVRSWRNKPAVLACAAWRSAVKTRRRHSHAVSGVAIMVLRTWQHRLLEHAAVGQLPAIQDLVADLVVYVAVWQQCFCGNLSIDGEYCVVQPDPMLASHLQGFSSKFSLRLTQSLGSLVACRVLSSRLYKMRGRLYFSGASL